MSKILGLDLGTNSIGWALIDDALNVIINCGVRIFPEGVNRNTQGKEVKKNEERRLKRQLRRQLLRRKYRKWQLAEFLMQHGMFPQVENIKAALQEASPCQALREFFSVDPYACRSRAVHQEKLTLTELGRVFYHFAQRRGYKESLKDDAADSGTLYEGSVKDGKTGINETNALIAEFGTLGNGLYHTNPYVSADANNKRWRNRYTTRQMYTQEFETIWQSQQPFYPELLTDEMMHKIGHATEGLLFFQRPLKGQSHLVGKCTLEPNKQRSNDSCIAFELRRMYEFINSIRIDGHPLAERERTVAKEFFLSKEKFAFSELAAKLKINVNRFNYEEDRQVVGTKSISTLRKIFTPKVWDAKTLEEQEAVVNIKRFAEDREKTAAYLKKTYDFTDKQVTQFLKFRPTKGYASLSYKATLNILPFLEAGYIYNEAVWLGGVVNALGKQRWNSFDANRQDYIVTNALEIYGNTAYESKTTTAQWLQTEFGLTGKETAKLYHHSVDDSKGDGSETELPAPPNLRNPVVLQCLFEVRKLVNAVIKLYGKPDQMRVELSRELKSSVQERDEMRLRQFNNERENDTIKKLLDEIDEPHTAGNVLKYRLYREIEQKAGQVVCPYSGEEITPRKLFKERRFEVEHIIPYSMYPDDSFGNKTLCELTENRRKGKRTPYNFYFNEQGQQKWEEVKTRALKLLPYPKWLKFIDETNKSLEDFETRKLNDSRYISREARAYLEQVCKDVRVTQGELTAKLRHYWGLDSILNPAIKAPELEDGREYLVAIDENRNILEAIPWQQDRKKNDAAYDKLAKLGWVLQGNVSRGLFRGYKERYDHRHHVVDAITIACTKTSYLQKVSTMKARAENREDYEAREINFPEPWPGFHRFAANAVDAVTISHKKRSRTTTKVAKYIQLKGKKQRVTSIALRGPLHAETVYGKRKDLYGNAAFHVRKQLNQITKRAQVDKIADIQIKRLVEQAIITTWQQHNAPLFAEYLESGLIQPKGNGWVMNHLSKVKYDVPEGAFFEVVKDEKKKVTAVAPKVFLPVNLAKKTPEQQEKLLQMYPGGKIPVLKVRLRENSTGAVQLKENRNQWVEPSNNYGVLIYEDNAGKQQEYCISFWEAVERKKQGIPVFQLPPDGKNIVMTLQINDLLIAGIPPEEIDFNNKAQLADNLYRVQKLSSGDYNLRKANAATINFERELFRLRSAKALNSANITKVRIGILGDISPL